MNRFVVMVDAGYLLRQAIEIVSNRQSKKRGDLEIADPAGLIATLIAKSQAMLALSDKELLRVYWYDGVMANGLTPQQRSMVEVDDVQFRAGTVNGAGQQKGVDSLIVTDLIELTSHHAICDAILVTGDSDLAVGIELAQRRGVRIAVLGIEDLSAGVAHHQSFEITSRADRVGRLGGADMTGNFRYTPGVRRPQLPGAITTPAATGTVQATTAPPAIPIAIPIAPIAPPAPQPPSAAPASAPVSSGSPTTRVLTPADEAAIQAAVQSFVAQQASLVGAIDPVTSRIDAVIDKALIHHVFVELARGQLTNREKIFARGVFRSLA